MLALSSKKSWRNGRFSSPTPISRQQTEKAILAATVRFEMETWVKCENRHAHKRAANGHGTIMNGRYLLTHNHLDETITSRLLTGSSPQSITIRLYNISGQLMAAVLANQVTVVARDSETLVLDFGQQGSTGFFTIHDLPSAQFMAAANLPLTIGTKVAQIDWDGTSTYIAWATIETIKTISDTPTVQLSNRIAQGASGGGVYWNGIHIGNNWKTSTDIITPIEKAESYSHAALNTLHILKPGNLSNSDVYRPG